MKAITPMSTTIYHSHSRNLHIYAVPSAAETSFDPMNYQGSAIPAFPSTLTERLAEPLLHQMACRHLNFDDSPPPAVDSNSDIAEGFPTAPLDDLV